MATITIVDPLGEHGGMNYYTHGLAKAIAEEGLAVTVLSPPSALHQNVGYRWQSAYTGTYGKANKLIRGLRLLQGSLAMVAHGLRNRTDWTVLHVFRADRRDLLDITLAKTAGRKIACIIHDVSRTDKAIAQNKMARIVAMSDRLVVHNGYSRDALCEAVPQAADKVSVIAHGSFVGQFEQPSQAEARAALDLPINGTILLFFGHQRPEKGLEVALRALQPFRDRADLTLVVAGKAKAEERARIMALAQTMRVSSRVRFAFGHVPDAQVPDHYCAASVVLLPYRRIYESGVALMALSFGRPVIASDIPTLAALATDCGGVVTFADGDASDLSRRIAEVLIGTLDLEAMGQEGFAYAEKARSWAASGQAWAALLRKK